MKYKSNNTFFMDEGKTLNRLKHYTSFSHYSEKSLSVVNYRNALVFPFSNGMQHINAGGVFDENHIAIYNSGLNEDNFNIQWDGNYGIYVDADVIYLGCFVSVWGHIITDCIAKLWYLNTEECNIRIRNGAKVVYITYDSKPLKPYIIELISLAGFNVEDWERIEYPTCYSNVYIPDNSFYLDGRCRYFTREYITIIDKIKANCSTYSNSPTPPKKIYYTRTALKDRIRDYGEKRVENFFRKQGYTIIAPEKLTVIQQVQYLMSCKAFASTLGSISHNVIFCSPNTVVSLLQKSDYENTYQTALNDLSSLVVQYIDVNKSIFMDKKQKWLGPFFIYPNHWLMQAFNILDDGESIWTNTEFWRYCFNSTIALYLRGWFNGILYRLSKFILK